MFVTSAALQNSVFTETLNALSLLLEGYDKICWSNSCEVH